MNNVLLYTYSIIEALKLPALVVLVDDKNWTEC